MSLQIAQATPASLKQTIGTRSNITEEHLAIILQHIRENPQQLGDVVPNGDRVRRIGFKSDGSRWIHLNRNKSQSDLIVGRGVSKKAVHTVNSATGELAVRTTEIWYANSSYTTRESNTIKRLHEHNVPNIIKVYHEGVFQSKMLPEYDPTFKYERIQEYCDGGNLFDYLHTPKEDRKIVINPIGFASKLLDTFIAATKIGLTIDDLKAANILINKHGDPVIADWGQVVAWDPNDHDAALRNYQMTVDLITRVFVRLFSIYPEHHLLMDSLFQCGEPALENFREHLNTLVSS